MPVVAVVVVVLLGLATAFHLASRTRDSQVRLATDQARARFLARATVQALQFAFRQATEGTHAFAGAASLSSGHLPDVLLNGREGLARVWGRKAPLGQDHRPFLEQVLGTEALEPIDDLARFAHDGRLRFTVEYETDPAPRPPGHLDPVAKQVTFHYDVEAHVGEGARDRYRGTDSLSVGSRLPILLSKLTAAGHTRPPSPNGLSNDESGVREDGRTPVLLFHGGEISPSSSTDPSSSSLPPRPMPPLFASVPPEGPGEAASDALAGRGLVHLAGSSVAKITAGTRNLGQESMVAPPDPAETPLPRERVSLPELSEATEVTFTGFHREVRLPNLLGSPPAFLSAPDSAHLHLFGTAAVPSPTVVMGDSRLALGAVFRRQRPDGTTVTTSRILTPPVNAAHVLGTRPRLEALGMLAALTVSSDAGPASLLEKTLQRQWDLYHTDALHRAVEASEGHRRYFSTEGLEDPEADMFAAGTLQSPPLVGDTFVVHDQGEFERFFLVGGELDLQGFEVIFVPDKGAPPPTLELPGAVRVRPGMGGSIQVETFISRGLRNPTAREDLAPIRVRARRAVLEGAGPHAAMFEVEEVETRGLAPAVWIEGNLSCRCGPGGPGFGPSGGGLPRVEGDPALAVAYDVRLDPTGPNYQDTYLFDFALASHHLEQLPPIWDEGEDRK